MAHTVITLSSKFDLRLRIKRIDSTKIEKMLTDNVIIFFVEPCTYSGFTVYIVPMLNLRKAELVRRLIENIQVYD